MLEASQWTSTRNDAQWSSFITQGRPGYLLLSSPLDPFNFDEKLSSLTRSFSSCLLVIKSAGGNWPSIAEKLQLLEKMYPLFFVRYITSKDHTDCRWGDGPSFKPRCILITALYSQINGHRFHSKGEPPDWTVHVPELKVLTKFRNLNSILFHSIIERPPIQSLTIFSKQKILFFMCALISIITYFNCQEMC